MLSTKHSFMIFRCWLNWYIFFRQIIHSGCSKFRCRKKKVLKSILTKKIGLSTKPGQERRSTLWNPKSSLMSPDCRLATKIIVIINNIIVAVMLPTSLSSSPSSSSSTSITICPHHLQHHHTDHPHHQQHYHHQHNLHQLHLHRHHLHHLLWNPKSGLMSLTCRLSSGRVGLARPEWLGKFMASNSQ